MKSKFTFSPWVDFALLCFLLLIFGGLKLLPNWSPHYTYRSVTAANKVQLCYIKTAPENIALYTSGSLLDFEQSGLYGINGGFFDENSQTIVSIALVNGKPIGSNKGYNGCSNGGKRRGTLIWDASAKKFLIKPLVYQAEVEKLVQHKTNYWAQGGISMTLDNDQTWADIARTEQMPNQEGTTYRTAIAYDKHKNLYLIISENRCSAADFRFAIKKSLSYHRLVDGIFLDGDTCSQLRCEFKSVTYNRPIMEIIALKKF